MRFRFRHTRLMIGAMTSAAILALAWSAAGSAAPTTTAPVLSGVGADKPRLAVLDFNVGEDIKTGHGVALAAIVREECQNSQRYDLMDRNMMKERMTEKDFAATTECDNVRCLVRYGKTLDVHKIIGGFATSFGKSWMVTIRLVDVNTGREEKTFSQDCRGDMECLLALSRQGARVLLGLEADAALPAPAKTPPPFAGDVLTLDLGGGVTMRLKRIEPGTFTMGSNDGDDDEKPLHRVSIARAFYIGVTEVTQAQWQAVMGSNPSNFKGDGNLPVEQVSWNDCQEFCRKLSHTTGMSMRLPTEAEWEYACRAGRTGKYGFGDSESQLGEYAWSNGNSGSQTHAVGTRKPNAWGLYDMHGNVWEWCEDVYHETYAGAPVDGSAWTSGEDSSFRVHRGGSWFDASRYCRAAYRPGYMPGDPRSTGGFRVVGLVGGAAGTE